MAFATGWEKAQAVASVARDVFVQREIDTDELAQALGELLLISDEIAVDEPKGLAF